MLTRDQRITEPDDFRRVIRRGERSIAPHVIIYRTSGDRPRVGIVVSRKCGNAIVRNTLRRRTRAIARGLIDTQRLSGDVVIRFRCEGTTPDFRTLETELVGAVAKWSGETE